jgi:transposase-like protein
MNIHKNARTTPQSRAEIVRRVVTLQQPARQVATAFGISERTVRKWVARARPSPAASLTDGSSQVRLSAPPRPQARTLTGRARRRA